MFDTTYFHTLHNQGATTYNGRVNMRQDGEDVCRDRVETKEDDCGDRSLVKGE